MPDQHYTKNHHQITFIQKHILSLGNPGPVKNNKYNPKLRNVKKLCRVLHGTTLLREDPKGLIVNLSSKTFSVYEFKLLNKDSTSVRHLECIVIMNSRTISNSFQEKYNFVDHTDTTTSKNREFKPETDKTWEPKSHCKNISRCFGKRS